MALKNAEQKNILRSETLLKFFFAFLFGDSKVLFLIKVEVF